MRKALLALMLVLPQLALAGRVKRVAELPDLKLANPRKINAHRHLLTSVRWVEAVKGRSVPHYQLFDLETRQVVDVPIPLADMPAAQLELLGARQPSIELVHSTSEVSSFTVTARKNGQPVATYLGQFDHRSGQFRDLVLLCPWEGRHHIQSLGFDALDQFFYFARVTDSEAPVGLGGYVDLEVARVDLRTRVIDWQVKVELPQRTRPLQLTNNRATFSPDGSKLALIEYNEVSLRTQYPRDPQQQVYVIDVASKAVDAYPAPLSAYAATFSRDARTLILGSNETGDMAHIDLVQKKVDRQAKGHRLVHEFYLTPSGRSFLVISNTVLSSPKVIEVRRVADLSVQASIPVRLLYPGVDGIVPEIHTGLDGRLLVLPVVDRKGWARGQGLRLYEVPDDVDSPQVDGPGAADVTRAMAIVVGKQYADAQGWLYEQTQEDPNATFSKAALATNGDICVTGILSENRDGDYKPGRTRPVIARLDPTGRERWRQVVVKKGFIDYEDLGVAASPDGACVFGVYAYIHPGRHPNSRLLKVDPKGKALWDYVSAGTGGSKHRLGDTFELRSDGSVLITGRWYEDAEDKLRHDWRAVIAADGRVLSDEISP